jgi:DNA-binding GntR family transcriptional regulator
MALRLAQPAGDASSPPSVTTVPQGGTPDRIAGAIVRRILERRYTPGERITEAELTNDFGIGRSTVRESFRILAANGAIELTRHRGAVVCALTESDCRDLLDVMEVLLGLAARLAARNIEFGDNRARLDQVAQVLRRRHGGRALAGVLEERHDFYNVMLRIAANRDLDRALPGARAQIFRAQFFDRLTVDDLRAMVSEYRGIVDAILQGDERKAERRMREHVERTGDRLMPRLFKQWRRKGA